MKNAPIREKIESMFLWVALGDFWGVPTEMKTAEKIRQRFGRVEGFLPTRHNAMFVKDGFSPDSDDAGYYSDDTVLTFATLRSISNSGKIDQRDLVSEQLKAASEWPYGFGRATTEVFNKIRNGSEALSSGIPTAGNGVLMKQSPFAGYEALTRHDSGTTESEVAAYVRVTHDSPEAVTASLVHHKVLVSLLLDGFSDAGTLLSLALESAERFENSATSDGLKDRVSDRIRALLRMSNLPGWFSSVPDSEIGRVFDWGEKIGASCYALTTLGISYALFLRKPRSIEALFDAVNFWGDTDSYAGIVGSMLGAANGKFYSEALFSEIRWGSVLKDEAKTFVDTVGKSGSK